MKETGRVFCKSAVKVDGRQFQSCNFAECRLVYSGGEPPSFIACAFQGTTFVFDGPAGNAVAFLKRMASPKSGLQPLIAKTFPALGGH